MIHFNVPPVVGNELQYMEEAIKNRKICGDGMFTKNVPPGWKKKQVQQKLY